MLSKAKGKTLIMEKIYKQIINIIIDAGEIMLKAKELHLTQKTGNQNFVTQYDTAVQNYLIQKLSALLPEAAFLAEETTSIPLSTTEYCFIIDPIDGTTNFIHHVNHSAISVALTQNRAVIFGCVYNPYTREVFHAIKNQGAFLNEHPIEVTTNNLSQALIAYGTTPYNLDYLEKTFATVIKCLRQCREARRNGAASLDLVNLAAGRYDGFFEYWLQPWDFAAALLIVKEAKGIISDFSGNEVFADQPSSIVAGNSLVYQELLNLIEK